MADVVGGGGSSLRKSFQRQLYSLVASRTALAVALVLAVLTLNSAFQFAESLVEWSRAVNANAPGTARADPFRNNVAGASFQERLCSPVPIDIVYTWVNGSDPRLAAGARVAQTPGWGAWRGRTSGRECGWAQEVPAPWPFQGLILTWGARTHGGAGHATALALHKALLDEHAAGA